MLSAANRWVTEFEMKQTDWQEKWDQFVPMFIMTEVDIVLLIFITRAEITRSYIAPFLFCKKSRQLAAIYRTNGPVS